MVNVVGRTADQVFIPLTVGGGVRSVGDVDRLLRAGADKVSLNTAAIARPELLAEAAQRFGSQCVVLSVDARRVAGGLTQFEVTTHGGRRGTGIDAVQWAARGAELGVGEILLNSMDADGTKAGSDLELIRADQRGRGRARHRQRRGRRAGALRPRGRRGRRCRAGRQRVPLRPAADRRGQGRAAPCAATRSGRAHPAGSPPHVLTLRAHPPAKRAARRYAGVVVHRGGHRRPATRSAAAGTCPPCD